jgi:hypothetical protein
VPIQIDGDFPGGNMVVEQLDGDEVRLHQDLRDTTQDWFYWSMRVRGAEGRTVRFSFTQSRAIGVRGPAVSLDSGWTWQWLGAGSVHGNAFTYAFAPHATDARLSFGMPYQHEQWLRFADGLGGNPAFVRHPLCISEKGRAVEYVLLGCPGVEPQHRMAITCRHHCCEMMVNYTLEGLIEWVAQSDGNEARWLRDNVQTFIVPLVDQDGVENGDQGKGRQPRDHGRDYVAESIFSSTAAIRKLLPAWGGDRLRAGLDLHCPWISGDHNEVIYLVGSEHKRIEEEERRFSEILESVARGPLPFSAGDFLPFGQSWNVSANYGGFKGFSRWVSELPGVRLGAGMEIPYANASGAEVNQASARLFGIDLGKGLAKYLRSID